MSATCQCPRNDPPLPWSCWSPITQEDLLCDQCRLGCNMATKDGDGVVHHYRIKYGSLQMKTA